METISVQTHAREELVDITSAVRSLIHANDWKDGAILLFCPHTTGAVTINEGDVQYPNLPIVESK